MARVEASGNGTGRRRGRPRDAGADEAILREALEEIAGSGVRNFSVARVARRAGVAKGTIYLRWPEREQLILDALESTGRVFTRPDTGDLRSDLRHVVKQWAEYSRSPAERRVYVRLEMDREIHPEIWEKYLEFATPVNRYIEDVVRQARRRGEVRPRVSPRAVARSIVGAMEVQAGFGAHTGISEGFERELVDLLYHGVAAPEHMR